MRLKHNRVNRKKKTSGTPPNLNQTKAPADIKSSLNFGYERHLECDDCRSSKKFCQKHQEGKKELVQHLVPFFKSFNKERIIEELKRTFEIDNTIHHEISPKIRNLARSKLPRFLLLAILQDLKEQKIDLQIRINLAQAVKHGAKRDLDAQYGELLEVLQGSHAKIKSEIVWALGYKVKDSLEKPPQELIVSMKAEMTEDIDPKARSFFESQISEEINQKDWQANSNDVLILEKNLKTKRIVTKNQQISKSHQKNAISQEVNLEISRLLEKLRNKEKKARLHSTAERLPEEVKESKGSDLLLFSGTYVNAQHFYDLARSRKVIKDYNKDGFLTDKFLDGAKCFTGGLLGDLMTDRMIAKTFEMISKKQRLTEKTIAKLTLCLNNVNVMIAFYSPNSVDAMARKMFAFDFGKSFEEMMIDQLLSSDIPKTPEEMKDFPNEVKKIKDSNIRSEYDRERIWKLFEEEVDLIRKDAMTALYNCALRDKKIMTIEFLNQLENCLDDPNKNIESIAVRFFAVLNDSKEINYAKVFATCLHQLEENFEPEQSLDYIDQQSKDPKRCEELFTEEVVKRLSNLLTKLPDTEKLKIDCVEVINNYLEHSFTKGLNPEILNKFCLILKDESIEEKQERNDLKERVLISILLTAEKTNELPKSIVKALVTKVRNLGDYSANFIIFILWTICETSHIPNLEEISSKLQDNRVLIGEGSTITFESPSSENSSELAISTIAGKIIVSSLTKGAGLLNSQALKNLVDALASSDRQTRILAAKAISVALDGNQAELSKNFLIKLELYFADTIPDVAIYSKNAYTKILSELSTGNILLSQNQMEALASIYADEDLVLENQDFSPVIKENTLSILANQAKKQRFSEDIMGIFNEIFMLDDTRIQVALDIMKSYIEKFKLPENTIAAIENVLGKPEFARKALNLLERVIENGQAVNDSTLKIFADNLYSSNNDDAQEEELKIQSFKLLEKADENQDLPDYIFDILELERAGAEIGSGSFDVEDALSFLEIQTQVRKRLPSNVLKALSGHIQNSQTLSILINVTTNGQILPAFVINELSKILDPENKQLMKIFSNLAKNNQDIPIDVLQKLKKNLGGTKVHIKETLFIFSYWIQRGNRLSKKLIKKISGEFFSTENQIIKHECLSVFVLIIKTHQNLSERLAEKVLIRGLIDENEHIMKTSLKGFDFLCSEKPKLSEDCIEALVRKIVHSTCPHELKQEIKRLLGSQKLNEHQANLLKLAMLDCESGDQLLDSLIEISKQGGNFLQKNFQQINTILNESPASQKKAIDMLIKYANKNDIPEYLVNSIATIMLSTSIRQLKDQCLALIEKIAEVGRVLPGKTVSLIMPLQGSNQALLKKIKQNQGIPKVTNGSLQQKPRLLISLLTERLKNPEISKDYIDWLASTLSTKLSSPVIKKLLGAISEVKNLGEFESLIDFVEENKVDSNMIVVEDSSVHDLKRFLKIKLLGDQIKSRINRFKFATVIDKLLDGNWSFDQLMKMFQKTKSSQMKAKEQNLLQILDIISHYKIPVNKFEKILDILDDEVSKWIQQTNHIAIQSCFPTTQEKTDLLADLKKMNPLNKSLEGLNLDKTIEQINDLKLMSCIDFKKYLSKAQLKRLDSPISEWTKKEIFDWAKNIKSHPEHLDSPSFLVEALAVIKRANFLHTGFYLKDAQILSCIVLLNIDPEKGRLLQVGTGEGKSTIVSVIAIIHALKGKKVDIITSSPVLAERDAKEKEKAGLYKMFGLSCMDNCDKSLYIKGQKICYKKDIVYGEIAQFQFDTLRDEYSLLNTLAGRKCEVAIVDEVDSMLIDDSSYIARLSCTIAGMDSLQPFIHFIWSELNQLQQRVIVVDGKSYLLSKQATEIPKTPEDLNKNSKEIEGDIEKFLKKHVENYLKEDLLKNGKVRIPKNFKKFVLNQIPNWIDNAVIALMNQEDQQYIIQNGAIKPVAFNSTGVVQNDTSFGDGLHQLLQRKHCLKMASETLTTNFLSNIGYIKKYKHNLFGLSGTLGSEKTKEVLSKVYNVDLVQIPLEKKKKYLELPAVICNDHNQYLEEICQSTLDEVRKERSVLIICQTIDHCKLICRELGKRYRKGAIKHYTMNNMNQEKEIEKINPGEIIVATNLAGRGTDIKTGDIEKNGGLHVIITFLPPNQRVEDQAFGRTSRQGKYGTGQMIFNRSALFQYGNTSSQKIKEKRDNFESEMFNEFLEKELPIINIKDKLFAKFCVLKNKVYEKLKASTGSSSVYEAHMFNALEERWALFLRKIDHVIIPFGQSDEKYEKFEQKILEKLDKNELIKNPNYHISIANELLVSHSLFGSKYDQALKHFEAAIKLDPRQSAAAFVGKAWMAIKVKRKNHKKSQIVNDLIEALKLLSDEMNLLTDLQCILQKEDPHLESDLLKQLNQKISILGSYGNSIENAITVIKKSQRLIDVTGIRYCQRERQFERKGEDDVERKDYNADAIEIISKFYDLEREDLRKETLQKIGTHDKFSVVFNDLTVFSDLGDHDQAIQTINAFETSKGTLYQRTKSFFKSSSGQDPSSYKDLTLAIERFNIEELKRMLDPDIKIMDLDKAMALNELSAFPKSRQVHFESVQRGQVPKKQQLKVKEAIKILEREKDEELRFNILLEKANESKNSMFINKEILNDLTLTLEFSNLDCEIAKTRVRETGHNNSLQLEISGPKKEILKALGNPNLKCVQLFTARMTNVFETLYIDVAKKRISEMKDGQISIKLEDLNSKLTETLISDCPSAKFQLTFIGVKPSQILKDANGGTINLGFTKMSSLTAQKLIPILRKASLDFTLQFDNLNALQLKNVIEKASLQQESLEITKVKRLSELWSGNARPDLELSEFAARGIEYVFEINEKRFIPWRSILTVVVIGSAQIALGGVLISTGFGTTLGIGLMTEGAADYVTAIRAYCKRSFRWSDYSKQKAVSLAISAASIGVAGMKDGAKGLQIAVSGINKGALEQAGTQVIMNNQAVSTTLIQAGISLKKLAFQQAAITISQAVTREGLNQIFDALCNFALEQFKPAISSFIQRKIEAKFSQESFWLLISKMYALDKVLKLKSFPNLINNIIHRIISSENSQNHGGWDSIGTSLCKGILSDPKLLGSSFSMQTRIIGSLSGLTQVAFMINNIYSQLFQKISEIDQDSLSIHQILQQYYQIPLEDAVKISEILKAKDVIKTHQYEIPSQLATRVSKVVKGINLQSQDLLDKLQPDTEAFEFDSETALDCEYINPKKFKDLSESAEKGIYVPTMHSRDYSKKTTLKDLQFGQQERYKEIVLKLCEDLNKYTQTMSLNELSEIIKSVSDEITDQIIRVTESHLITPWSSYGVAQFTNHISATIQTQMIKDQIKSNIETESKYLKELEAKESKTPEEANKIAEYKTEIEEKSQLIEKEQITYADQIGYEAKKYTIGYASQFQKSKPAEMNDMLRMASQHGIKFLMVENADYVLTEEQKAEGVKLVLYTPGEKTEKGSEVGNYQLLDSNGKNVEIPSQGNDSGFEVISALLKDEGKTVSVGELRKELGEEIKQDSADSYKVIETRGWVNSHYSKEANKHLEDGGSLDPKGDSLEEKKENSRTFLNETKTWQQTFQDNIGEIKTVIVGINKIGNLILKVSNRATASYIFPILTITNFAETCLISTDVALEVIKSGVENGVVSDKFLKDVFLQGKKNIKDFLRAASQIKCEFTEKSRPELQKMKSRNRRDLTSFTGVQGGVGKPLIGEP